LKSGHKLEEYAIGVPAKLAAASKKVSRRVARKPASKAKGKRS
jgi:hypothetical protein